MITATVALATETSPLIADNQPRAPLTRHERCSQAITGAVSVVLAGGMEAGVVFGSNAMLNLRHVNFGIVCGMMGLIVTAIVGLVPLYLGQDMLVQSCCDNRSEAYTLVVKAKNCLAKALFQRNPPEPKALVEA